MAGTITDVSNVVQAEINRIIKDNHNNACITINNGQQHIIDVIKTQTVIGSNCMVMQASPISVSSQGSNGSDSNSINNAIIAQLTRGNGGGDDGDGNGNGSNGNGNGNGNGSASIGRGATRGRRERAIHILRTRPDNLESKKGSILLFLCVT